MNAAAADAWTFLPDPASTREARRRVSDALEAAALEAAAATAALVVCELATNAILHARTPFEVRVRTVGNVIRIEVHDGSPRRPSQRFFSDEATSGRGLRLVQSLCPSWGVDVDDDGAGKTVWAEVLVPEAGAQGYLDLDSEEEW